MAPAPKRRKTDSTRIEEVTFDLADRQDYLTGFHKRKLQRTKHAKEIAEKKARAERIEHRRKVYFCRNSMSCISDLEHSYERRENKIFNVMSQRSMPC
jgi:Nucleolar protein 12 (25kDa)